MNIIQGIITGAVCLFAYSITAQTAPDFNSATVTDEGAIRLSWNSTSNEIYEVDYADALASNDDGSTAWVKLYDNYPSHGTNTFWLDTGDYDLDPPVLHPRRTDARFYRIVVHGADTASGKPTLAITSPTTGAAVTGNLTVTVSAATDQASLFTKLYVDGEQMPMRISGTNYFDTGTNYISDTYIINSCEWGNGQHVLFATAETSSTLAGQNNATQPLVGHAVSAYMPVVFRNLITRVSFSECFFQPELGQTQQVSAVFAANCDWTLNIIDEFTNTVRSTSGSGNSMVFNWDGNNNSGTELPAGIYHYVISAQTNGQTSLSSFGGASGAELLLSSIGNETAEDWFPTSSREALAAGLTSYFTPPFPMPPVRVQTNGGKWTYVPYEDVYGPQPWTEIQVPVRMQERFLSAVSGESMMTMESASAAAAPSSQTTTAPKRPPTAPVARLAGTVGVGYQRYLCWTNNYAPEAPRNGILSQHVALEGQSGIYPISFHSLGLYEDEAKSFIENMKDFAGWKTTVKKTDDNLKSSDLTGSGSPFNQVNIALLLLHGTYGTGLDYTAGGIKQMYFALASGCGAGYLRMSDMNWGGSGANGLKWMAIMACFSLQHNNWHYMDDHGVKPYNSDLHLLLGCDTTEYADRDMMGDWARYIAIGLEDRVPLEIRVAWYQAAKYRYSFTVMPTTQTTALQWAVAGDTACYHDTLKTNSTPSGTWFYETETVWQP